jgi:hypothetical protein
MCVATVSHSINRSVKAFFLFTLYQKIEFSLISQSKPCFSLLYIRKLNFQKTEFSLDLGLVPFYARSLWSHTQIPVYTKSLWYPISRNQSHSFLLSLDPHLELDLHLNPHKPSYLSTIFPLTILTVIPKDLTGNRVTKAQSRSRTWNYQFGSN